MSIIRWYFASNNQCIILHISKLYFFPLQQNNSSVKLQCTRQIRRDVWCNFGKTISSSVFRSNITQLRFLSRRNICKEMLILHSNQFIWSFPKQYQQKSLNSILADSKDHMRANSLHLSYRTPCSILESFLYFNL